MDNFIYFVLSDNDRWVFWNYEDFYSYIHNDLPIETKVYQNFCNGELFSQYYYVDNKLVAFSVRFSTN